MIRAYQLCVKTDNVKQKRQRSRFKSIKNEEGCAIIMSHFDLWPLTYKLKILKCFSNFITQLNKASF